MAAAGLGVLVIACNATPEIPNDLKSNSGTYPGRSRNGDSETEAAPEGDSQEQELKGGRGPSQPQSDDDAGPAATPDAGTPEPVDAGTTPSPAAGPCAGEATKNACFSCCETKNPGLGAKWGQYWDDCACAANRCGNQCAQSWC